MKIEQVAVQLYTLRDFTKTAADLATTFRRIREIGYQAAQLSAVGPIPEAEIRSMAAGEGITLCATHEGTQKIINEPEAVIARLDALGIDYTAVPNFGVELSPAKLEDVDFLIDRMEAVGAQFRAAGKGLTYHNHAIEFARHEGETIFERIFRRTSPENLGSELDTYWVQYGGADPVAWCRKLAGRLPLLHLKDYAIGFDNTPYYTEIGQGNLDFKAIIAAAEASGCQWFIVEQDTCPGDPFDSLRISFNHIRENLVEA